MKKNTDDLGYLGEDFQFRLVHHFFADIDFFRELYQIVDQNVFTNHILRSIVAILRDLYQEKDEPPNYRLVELEIREKSFSDADLEINLATLEKIKSMDNEDENHIKKLGLKFFKQQNIIKTAQKILQIADKGDESAYEDCVDLLTEALSKGVTDNFGVNLFDDLDLTLSEDSRIVIPTGINKVDETLEGGLGKGELGVIIGPSSFGKTSLTTAMASHAATFKCKQNDFKGFKVVQIFFEDRENQIRRKHIARLVTLQSGEEVEAKDLSKAENVEKVKGVLDTYEDYSMISENLRMVRWPSGEISATYLKTYLKRMINSGFKPDLVIIDYFECLNTEASSKDGDLWYKEGKTMRKIESMANELNVAIWVPTQGNKNSFGQELIKMQDAGGSNKKVEIAHIITSIARSTEDIANNRATFAILKNRAGKSGVVFENIYFNNGTCIMDCDDSATDTEMDLFAVQQKENCAMDVFKKVAAKKAKKLK